MVPASPLRELRMAKCIVLCHVPAIVPGGPELRGEQPAS